MRIFFDTNVVLDLLAFAPSASRATEIEFKPGVVI